MRMVSGVIQRGRDLKEVGGMMRKGKERKSGNG